MMISKRRTAYLNTATDPLRRAMLAALVIMITFIHDAAGRDVFGGDSIPDGLAELLDSGRYLLNDGNYDEAEQTFRKALTWSKKELGATHRITWMLIGDVGEAMQERGEYTQAEPWIRRSHNGFVKTYGGTADESLQSAHRLASLLFDMAKYEEAEKVTRQNVKRHAKRYGKTHPATVYTLGILAQVLTNQGKLDEAEPLCRMIMLGTEAAMGPEHDQTMEAVHALSVVLHLQGKLDEAETMMRRTVAWTNATFVAGYGRERETLAAFTELGNLLAVQGKYGEAIELLRQALEGEENLLGPTHKDTQYTGQILRRVEKSLLEAESHKGGVERAHETAGENEL